MSQHHTRAFFQRTPYRRPGLFLERNDQCSPPSQSDRGPSEPRTTRHSALEGSSSFAYLAATRCECPPRCLPETGRSMARPERVTFGLSVQVTLITGLLSLGSQVRVLPGAPFLAGPLRNRKSVVTLLPDVVPPGSNTNAPGDTTALATSMRRRRQTMSRAPTRRWAWFARSNRRAPDARSTSR